VAFGCGVEGICDEDSSVESSLDFLLWTLLNMEVEASAAICFFRYINKTEINNNVNSENIIATTH
jgi:hypothetical protein